MNKRIAAGVLAGLLAGAGAGVVLGVPGLATGQESPGVTEPATTDPATDDATDDTSDVRPEKGQWVRDALAPLVESGELTEAQVDAVVAALEDARPERGPGGPGMHRGPGGAGLEAAAGALGMTADELGQALRDGQTIAEVAASRSIDVQVVIDAMVADLQTHLAEHVEAGDITQEQADERLAGATEAITAMVNGERPVRGPMGPGGDGHRGPRPGGPGFGGPDAPEDATGTSA